MEIKRMLPPAGAPIYLKDIREGVKGMTWSSKAIIEIEQSVKSYFKVKHVFMTSSGKAALTVILRALADLKPRTEVIIPSYTCFSVPAAVAKAGLRIVLCDIESTSLDYNMHNLQEVISHNTLCIIVSNLFGIPCDTDLLCRLARHNGTFVVEDCAQALGGELNGRPLGTLGDIAFFSFGRGKNLCAVAGGLIITQDDVIARAVARIMSRLSPPRFGASAAVLAKAILLSIFSHPLLYWVPAGLPFLGIGKTSYSTRFPVELPTGSAAGLAANWASKIKVFTAWRRMIAEKYKRELVQHGISLLKEPEDALAVYPRFPVIAGSEKERDYLYRNLQELGMGGSLNYPTGIARIPELPLSDVERESFPNGDLLAKRLVTLPTHPAVSEKDVQKILSVFRKEAPVALKGLTPASRGL